MTFKELREKSGMSRSRFGEYFGIPYRTVQNWELGLRECPDYLLDLMQYKLEKEGKIYQMINDDIDELDQILAEAHREATLLGMKQMMKDHEEFKKKHPRPKHKSEEESEEESEETS